MLSLTEQGVKNTDDGGLIKISKPPRTMVTSVPVVEFYKNVFREIVGCAEGEEHRIAHRMVGNALIKAANRSVTAEKLILYAAKQRSLDIVINWFDSKYDATKKKLLYNPMQIVVVTKGAVPKIKADTTFRGTFSPIVVLLHEMGHWRQFNDDKLKKYTVDLEGADDTLHSILCEFGAEFQPEWAGCAVVYLDDDNLPRVEYKVIDELNRALAGKRWQQCAKRRTYLEGGHSLLALRKVTKTGRQVELIEAGTALLELKQRLGRGPALWDAVMTFSYCNPIDESESVPLTFLRLEERFAPGLREGGIAKKVTDEVVGRNDQLKVMLDRVVPSISGNRRAEICKQWKETVMKLYDQYGLMFTYGRNHLDWSDAQTSEMVGNPITWFKRTLRMTWNKIRLNAALADETPDATLLGHIKTLSVAVGTNDLITRAVTELFKLDDYNSEDYNKLFETSSESTEMMAPPPVPMFGSSKKKKKVVEPQPTTGKTLFDEIHALRGKKFTSTRVKILTVTGDGSKSSTVLIQQINTKLANHDSYKTVQEGGRWWFTAAPDFAGWTEIGKQKGCALFNDLTPEQANGLVVPSLMAPLVEAALAEIGRCARGKILLAQASIVPTRVAIIAFPGAPGGFTPPGLVGVEPADYLKGKRGNNKTPVILWDPFRDTVYYASARAGARKYYLERVPAWVVLGHEIGHYNQWLSRKKHFVDMVTKVDIFGMDYPENVKINEHPLVRHARCQLRWGYPMSSSGEVFGNIERRPEVRTANRTKTLQTWAQSSAAAGKLSDLCVNKLLKKYKQFSLLKGSVYGGEHTLDDDQLKHT